MFFVSVLPAGARPLVGRAAAIVPPVGGRPREARAGGAMRLDAASAPPLPLRCLSVASPLGTAVGGLWQGHQFLPLIGKLFSRRTHLDAQDAIFPLVFASQWPQNAGSRDW